MVKHRFYKTDAFFLISLHKESSMEHGLQGKAKEKLNFSLPYCDSEVQTPHIFNQSVNQAKIMLPTLN